MEDKFVQYLSECDAIARAMLALANRCDKIPSLKPGDTWEGKPGRSHERNILEDAAIGSRKDKGLRQSALHEAVQQWRSERHHDYPYEIADRYCAMALEDKESPLVTLFERITRWMAAEAKTVTSESVLSVCRSEVPWRGQTFRQSKTCLRFSLNLFQYGRVVYGSVGAGIRALAALISQLAGGSVEVLDAALYLTIQGAVDDEALGKKIPVGRGTVIKAVKFYKNGHMDMWFESEELTTQVADAIHPKTPGDHHRFDTMRSTNGASANNYEKCNLCGLARRRPERTVGNLFQHELSDRLRGAHRIWRGAPAEHRKQQNIVLAERRELWRV